MAKDADTVESFARGLLENPQSGLTNLSGAPCPAGKCVSFELRDKNIYSKNGGVHALVIAFDREMPRYDGLLFETPQGPPTTQPTNTPVVFHFAPQYRRMPGRMFYAVLLDSNEEIFEGAKPNWDEVLKTVVVE
jgi:hypothetical protein